MAHIGIDARLTYYRVGGISTYIRRLIGAFETLDAAPGGLDHRLTILHSRKARERLSARFGAASLWTPAHHRIERLALSVELARLRLDVLHSPDFIPPLRGARRHVITVHDLTFLHEPEHKDAASRRYYNNQIQQAVAQADHILSVSEATRRDLIDMLNVPASKISVQPHGVDAQYRPLPAEDKTAASERLGIPAGCVLFVGTLEPRKNIPALLDAYAALPADLRARHPLLLVGRPGWLVDDITRGIDRLRASGHTIIHRADIADADLPAVYNLAGVLVLPSFYEGFGMPPLEAMACGTPVIVSDNSALPEVVGDTGLLIDADDPATLTAALDRALTDDAWRSTARERGLQRAKLFTWERSARVALAAYEAVL